MSTLVITFVVILTLVIVIIVVIIIVIHAVLAIRILDPREDAVVVAMSRAQHVVPHHAAAMSAPSYEVCPELPACRDVVQVRHLSVGVDMTTREIAIVVYRVAFDTSNKTVAGVVDTPIIIHASFELELVVVEVPFRHVVTPLFRIECEFLSLVVCNEVASIEGNASLLIHNRVKPKNLKFSDLYSNALTMLSAFW